MDHTTQRILGIAAICAPLLHSVTDLVEWLQGGFSPLQLWANYAAFLPIPAIMIGIYAVQRPRIALLGLVGAVLYGFAFIYFTFTTLMALTNNVASYADLWDQLGNAYTAHGAVMVVGGAMFGSATLRAGVLPSWASILFLAGLVLNLLLTFVPVAELYQAVGTVLRNAGLVGMGWAIWRNTLVYRQSPNNRMQRSGSP